MQRIVPQPPFEAFADFLRAEFPGASVSRASDEGARYEVFTLRRGATVQYFELSHEWLEQDRDDEIPLDRAVKEWGIADAVRGLMENGTLRITRQTVLTKV